MKAKNEKMKNGIVITQWNSEDKNSLHPNTIKEDSNLSNAIKEYFDRVLLPLGIKLIEQRHNVLITEIGMYGAFYGKDLKKILVN